MIARVVEQGFPARRVAALLNVSESGYYAWRERPVSDRDMRHVWLTRLIIDIHRQSGSAYGYRRIRQELDHRFGIRVSHGTVERLMRRAGIRGARGRLRAAPGGVRRAAPGAGWVLDTFACRTRDGDLCTAVVLDTAGRRLLGWSSAAAPDPGLLARALRTALNRHGDVPARTPGDPGFSCAFTERAVRSGGAPPGAAVGDWYDHAVAEAFWEHVHRALAALWTSPGLPPLGPELSRVLNRLAQQGHAVHGPDLTL
ncbi:IS3 family transposase [Streptomyces tropicalis]|uniref:IS3 family transposase n=1 Tax=Streptomyces tropicalis TaxID=3034234 RepID=A0ABT6A200_9ACTN|nr:IS3 family transposase [Streptomyces tropicalis]MDF3298674.1 IS3 family transposase [Streptomyces tropicalis]